ncbi:hypothetical protein FRC10_010661 [Ceratobasidium sp. 414]|nr:hypothetical protein FRC10_010661 [Ceratobasidium sp. 414]
MSSDEPKIAPNVSLPLTFQNSFWTSDYRTGLNVLFSKLEKGIVENAEIVAFLRARVAAERTIASSLINPPPTGARGTGFDTDDGAALLRAFQGLQTESAAQGDAHKNLAQELEKMVADPFENWAAGHAERIHETQHVLLDIYIKTYEDKGYDILKLKQTYLNKSRLANEAEDDAKFAPNQNLADAYTSPRLGPTTPSRTGTVSDRIRKSLGTSPSRGSSVASDATTETATTEAATIEIKVDKGKGRATTPPPEVASPPPMSPAMPPKLEIPKQAAPQPLSPILLAGLALSPAAVSALLLQASKELKTTTLKLPFIGDYKDCFTGADFVDFLRSKVPGFDDSVERAAEAARDLTERENLLRRVGEIGNAFEDSQAALYQFRPKAFKLEEDMRASLAPPASTDNSLAPSPSLLSPASNLMKRSNTVVNFISRAVKSANTPAEPPHVRARNEADVAERAYRAGVRALDRQRLGVEEKAEEGLKLLNKWEIERLRAVKTVLQQYQAALGSLTPALGASVARIGPLLDAFVPESDAAALIEHARTGPFRPVAHLFESRQLGEYAADGAFGLDLGKWGAAAWGEGESGVDTIPGVITALLDALAEKYKNLPSDEGESIFSLAVVELLFSAAELERRRTWIYEVPLSASHRLREAINDLPSEQPIPAELFAEFDAPIVAATTKLWFLELNPPLCMWETWDEMRKVYPSVGAAQTEDRRVEDLQTVLMRLPKVNLLVLDTIIKHLKELVEATEGTDEATDVYIAKLGLSLGRVLVVDLIERYEEILPPTVTKKKKEVARAAPQRKRTKPFDQRVSRRSMQMQQQDPRKLLEAQQASQAGRPGAGSNAGQTGNGPPPRPTFADPGEPPRPTFVEPGAPPTEGRPAFAEPRDDPAGLSVPGEGIIVHPPTPVTSTGPGESTDSPSNETPGSPPRAMSPPLRARSPPVEGTLSRTPSGTTRGAVRGPRMVARGPRAPPGAAAPSTSPTPPPTAPDRSSVSSIERPYISANPSDYAPRGRGGRTNASAFGRRDLATRTMASGSEDETVGK